VAGVSDRADIMTAVTSRQRDSERVPILGTLQGEVKVYQPMSVHQVSTGGMQVETAFPLHLDALYDFRLTLRDHSIVAKGRVVHSRIIDVDQDIVMYRSGVEFIELSTPVQETINALVEEIKSVHL
jgi:PilZ domain